MIEGIKDVSRAQLRLDVDRLGFAFALFRLFNRGYSGAAAIARLVDCGYDVVDIEHGVLVDAVEREAVGGDE